MDEEKITVDEVRALKIRVLNISQYIMFINNIKYGGHAEFIPRRCVTIISMAEIFMAKELKFYLEHNWQYAVLKKSIFRKLNPSFSLTFLKEHENNSITVSENILRGYVC